MKKIKKIKLEELEPMFKVGERVMLKSNLLIVEIKEITIKRCRYAYKVFYPHLYQNGTYRGFFTVFEDELEEKPIDYDQIIFDAYIEYRRKYEKLLERLRTPSVRQDY